VSGPDILAPDTGEVLRAFLSGQSAVTNVVSDRIGLNLTSTSPAIRYALVTGDNYGGGAVMVTWQVECWGWGDNAPDDGTCHALALTVMSLAPAMAGQINGATVSGAWASVPRSADDPLTGRPRDVVEITFSATP
jgi:hypothetical protein